MIQSQLKSQAQDIAAEFAGVDLKDLAQRFSFPIVVYLGKEILLLKTSEEFERALSKYRSVLSDEPLSKISSKLIDFSNEDEGLCKFSVRNQYLASDGRNLGADRINFYSDVSLGNPKIRMLEFLEWPCAKDLSGCEEFRTNIL